jgi:Fe-S-cluster containining protein
MKLPPFKRTVCDCEQCKECCRRQPGPLGVGDYERIRAHLGIDDTEMQKLFCASLGALVMDRLTGEIRRVGTITPQRQKGHCVFLDETGHCKIHAVAPMGCAYFDTHMNAAEGQRRGLWLIQTQETEEYQTLRKQLPYTTAYKPRQF